MYTPSETTATLTISCDDQPGIIAAVSSFMHLHGANITALDQHATAAEGGTFFQRLEFQTPHIDVARDVFERAFDEAVAKRFGLAWSMSYSSAPRKVAILVSKYDHALMELLWRFARGELHGEVVTVVSNHPDLREAVEAFGVPYVHIPVTKATKAEAEAALIEAIGDVDLVVLARYMQILTDKVVDHFRHRIINIHHSFLPAFVGANPYRKAYERGVKLIGATAHYVTAELDAGPIIEQDVSRVAHWQTVEDLKRQGEDMERQVLARAVRWHLEDRVLVHGNKTIVFAGS